MAADCPSVPMTDAELVNHGLTIKHRGTNLPNDVDRPWELAWHGVKITRHATENDARQATGQYRECITDSEHHKLVERALAEADARERGFAIRESLASAESEQEAGRSRAEVARLREQLAEWKLEFCISTGTTGADQMKASDQRAVVAELVGRAKRAGTLCDVEQHRSRIQLGTADNERLKGRVDEEQAKAFTLEKQLSSAHVALSLVSGALADTGTIPVGPAVEFGDGVRSLTRERDAARGALAELGDRIITIADEASGLHPVQSPEDALTRIERALFGYRAALAEKDAALREARATALEEAADLASRFSVKADRSIHPDIPWDRMSETAKTTAHTTAQQIAAAIRALSGQPPAQAARTPAEGK